MNLRIVSLACLMCAALLGAGPARAERADRNKPIQLDADSVTLDDTKQVGVFIGNVQLMQGTLNIHGDQIVASQGKRGFERGVVTGQPARFRQKGDHSDYVQGSGARIEYNAVNGVIDIYGGADIKRGQEEVHGEHIVYDLHKDTYQVFGGSKNAPDGRIHVVIPPHQTTPATPPRGEALPIKPDTRLPAPEDQQ